VRRGCEGFCPCIVWLGQFDWMVARFNGVTDKNNFRYSGVLVLHF
jgi:hypothetical protein